MDGFSHLYGATGDGLPVSDYRQHTLQKLGTLRYYLEALNSACKRTKPFGGWAFVDTFAGPGLVQVRDTERFFEGSALIGLRSGASVVHAIELQKANVSALEQRAEDRGIGAALRTHVGNANLIAPEIIAEIPPLTPAFVLQDPEGMELKWANVRAIARANSGRRIRKPEQLINFSDGILRLFWTNQPLTPGMENILGDYFGSAVWREIVDDRGSGRLEAGQTIRAAVELYKRQLRVDAGYTYVTDCEIRRDQVTRGQRAYHLVFASDHPDAPGIMEDAFKKVHVGQSRFPGMLPPSTDE